MKLDDKNSRLKDFFHVFEPNKLLLETVSQYLLSVPQQIQPSVVSIYVTFSRNLFI